MTIECRRINPTVDSVLDLEGGGHGGAVVEGHNNDVSGGIGGHGWGRGGRGLMRRRGALVVVSQMRTPSPWDPEAGVGRTAEGKRGWGDSFVKPRVGGIRLGSPQVPPGGYLPRRGSQGTQKS